MKNLEVLRKLFSKNWLARQSAQRWEFWLTIMAGWDEISRCAVGCLRPVESAQAGRCLGGSTRIFSCQCTQPMLILKKEPAAEMRNRFSGGFSVYP